ncbi:interleukin-17 receptor C [Pimephales promelas]|uniref:interleukin-17 receptor C n=1 Tax=Pimephales promelas TaxID=90988 RepID=UPI0019559E58|nr:interleukin-17 receptor C [Pimephales promelas]
MCGSPSITRVVVLCVLLNCSLCVKILRRDVLRLREEWIGADRLLPRLRLHTVLHQRDVCVRVRLCVHPLLKNETLEINFSDSESGVSDTLRLIPQTQHSVLWWITGDDQPHARIQTHETNRTSHQTAWILKYGCFPVRRGSTVTVSVHKGAEMLIRQSYTVTDDLPVPEVSVDDRDKHSDDAVPDARVTVDERHKRFTVRLETNRLVKISLCYKHSFRECVGFHFQKIDPAVHQTVNLSFPFLVPCVCVQLWFTSPDARRVTHCPLKEGTLPHGADILSSSSARVLGSVLHWEPLCPDDQSDVSVSLCWRIGMQNSDCVPAPNATLYGTKLKYNVSAVDEHPQMCVKFSLNGSRRVFCPFESESRSQWSVRVVPGSLRLHVYLTSDTAAAFAAQLCVRDGDVCVSRGLVTSRQLDGGAAEMSLRFPFLSSGLCVQVWRLDLLGRRIICPDFTHRRWGLVIGTSLTLLALLCLLVFVTRWLIRRITSVWRSADRRPVLLVCSSNGSTHISAVCSLASGLQGVLCMDVRLAQWMQCQPQSSLAQLGPVPWLYGQCRAVQKAGGLVLIVWSPDAHRAYRRWRNSEGKVNFSAVEEEEEEEEEAEEEECMEKPVELSCVTAPVFNAALSCLWMGIRSDGYARGFRLVSFQNNNNNTFIPKRLRCVRKYCLPKDLSSLIHDLTGSTTRWRCWPRLLSKVLSFFVSRQLAPTLAAKLPTPTDSPKLVPGFSRKVAKRKTWRQKKRRSKVVTSCLSRKGSWKKKTAPEPMNS